MVAHELHLENNMDTQFTQDDVANFAKSLGLGQNASPPPTTDSNLFTRAGKQILNFPTNVLNVTGQDLSNLVLAPQDRPTSPVFPQAAPVAAPTTFGQQAVDFVGAGLLPKAAEFALPYAGASKLAGLAGLGATASEIVGQGAAGALTSTEGGPNEMLRQGLTGAVLGAVSPLSRLQRILPLAAATGVATGLDVANGQDLQSAAIQNAAQFGFGLLPGVHGANPELKANPDIENTIGDPALLNMYDRANRPNLVNPQDLQSGLNTADTENPYGDAFTNVIKPSGMTLAADSSHLLSNESPLTNYPDTNHLAILQNQPDLSGLQIQSNYSQPLESQLSLAQQQSTSGLRLDPNDLPSQQGIPFDPTANVDTSHLKLAADLNQADPGNHLAILQNPESASVEAPAQSQGWPGPKDNIPFLQSPADIQHAASNVGVEYQGMSDMGLHAFKEPETGGNFSIRDGQVTPDTIQDKAQAVRDSFNQPEQFATVKLTANDAQEVMHKLSVLQDNPDMLEEYGKKTMDINQLVDAIPQGGGNWKIPHSMLDLVSGEMQDHVRVLRDIANDAYRNREQGQALSINKQAKKFENIFDKNSLSNQIKAARDNGNISGAISMHLATSLGGGVAGGLYGYQQSKGDWNKTAAYATLGLAAGAIGYRVLEALKNATPAAEVGVKASETASLKKVAATPLKDLAGQDISGRGGIMSKFVRALETQTWLHLPEEVKTALSQAQGKVTALVQQVNVALKGVKDYADISDELKDRASKFLKGQAADPAEVKNLINSEGGVNHEGWKDTPKDQKANLNAIWKLQDADGKTTDVFHVSSDTRDKLIQMENDTLTKGLQGNDLKFANFVQSARLATNAMQEMFSNAMPAGSNLKDIINNSVDQYMTRGYKIFTDKSFWPTEDNINKVIDKLGLQSGDATLQQALGDSKAYRMDDSTTGDKGWNTLMDQYQKDGKFDQVARLQNMVPLKHMDEDFMVDPKTKDLYDSKFDKDVLRGTVEDYLKETKQNKELYNLSGTSSGLDTTLLKERQELDPTFRELIGEFKDPVEEVTHTLNRLVPTAKAASLMSSLKDMQIHDLPATFEDSSAYVAYKKSLQSAIDNANAMGNKGDLAILQSRMNELLTYRNAGPDLKFGLLKDTYVSRFVADQFKDYNGPWGDMTNPIARGMATANMVSKLVHSPYNPVTQMRNMFQAPIFMAIGRVDPTNLSEAFKAARNAEHPLHGELLREGILPATHASGELGFKLDQLFNGQYDSELMKGIKAVHNFVLDKYNIPDSVTRAATYLSAKDRFASKLGLPLSHPDVIAKSVEFTNRYTMNYENIAPIVKFARNIPAFNLYVSYTAEIARITKNLVQDALKGDMIAMGTLGGLAATPYILQKTAEASLSPADKRQWDQLQAQLPDYARNRFRTNISKDSSGNFHYVDFTPLIVTDSFHQSVEALRKGDWRSLAAVNPIVGWQNTPAWNIIAEQVSGQDLFSGREFRNYNDRLETFAKEVTPSWTPGLGYEYQKLANIGITNQKTGRTESVEGAILRWTTGMSESSYNPDIVNKQALSDVKNKIDLEKQYLMDTLKTTASDDKKQRAVQVYQQAVQVIMNRYQSRLLPSQ